MVAPSISRRFFLGILAAFSTAKLWASEVFSSSRLDRFCFGSCNKQDKNQDYWNVIARFTPQLWLWLGDNIYANNASPAERAAEYNKQNRAPAYAAFKSNTLINGIWDDHDYYDNNADGSYAQKAESQRVALDFFGVSPISPRRTQEGLHYSYTFGTGRQMVEFIMLDTRYFKNLDRNYPMLGRTQYQWFVDTLENSSAALIFVLSGVHVTSEVAGGWFEPEGWSEFKEERRRFLEVIDRSNKNVIILSGDRHKHDFTDYPLASGRRVVEFMSSGLTHSSSRSISNRYRVGPEVMQTAFGAVDLVWADDAVRVDMSIRSTKDGKSLGILSRTYQLPE
jgi:alkaline phosphatase D